MHNSTWRKKKGIQIAEQARVWCSLSLIFPNQTNFNINFRIVTNKCSKIYQQAFEWWKTNVRRKRIFFFQRFISFSNRKKKFKRNTGGQKKLEYLKTPKEQQWKMIIDTRIRKSKGTRPTRETLKKKSNIRHSYDSVQCLRRAVRQQDKSCLFQFNDSRQNPYKNQKTKSDHK